MKRFRRIFLLIGVLSALALFLPLSGQTTAGPAPVGVTVLFFNDIHGYLMPFAIKTALGKEEVGGIARMATLIERIRSENRAKNIRTLVLIAGDILQGTPLSTVFKGRADVEIFNAMGVDALTVGNHEFDFGLPNFLDLKKTARFPFLSSNVVWKASREKICDPSISFRLAEGLDLTVIGATTRALLTTTHPKNVKDLDILDSVETVRDAFNRAKEKGPVIVLSHSGLQADRDLARALPDLAAVIGGHDHILLSPLPRVGNVPILQAFEKGRYLGRMDLRVDPVSKKATLISNAYLPVTAETAADPGIERIVATFHRRLGDKWQEVIGRSSVFLDAERVRYEETALGNLVTDIIRQYSHADMALLNGGSLRAGIDAGPVTVEDVFKTMPFANEVVLVELSGAEILQVLGRSVKGNRGDEDGGFLQVSGLRFAVRNHGVENVAVGPQQEALDIDKRYRVAINDFLAAGGDGYALFKEKPAEYTGLPLRELIVETIRTRGVVTAEIEGRIVRK